MSPIVRRSAFLYVTHLGTFSLWAVNALSEGRPPAFDVVPIFVPLWLSSSVLWSERDESYAFLRLLPVTDRDVVRVKFGLIFWMSAVYWMLTAGIVLARWDAHVAGPATVVYATLMWALALFLAATWQICIWRFGVSTMTGVIVAVAGLNLILGIVHTTGLRRGNWEPLSELAAVRWLAGAPWLTHAVVAALVLAGFYALMEVGVRVKTASEACL